MSDVTDELDQLAAGDIDLDQVVADFRTRQWPSAPEPADDDPFTLDAQDPEVEPPGAFIEVSTYYSMGKINDEQYAALAQAAAEAMKNNPSTPGTPAAGLNATGGSSGDPEGSTPS